MPLPTDQAVVETSDTLVKTLRGAFGTPESYRPGLFQLTSSTSIFRSMRILSDDALKLTPKVACSVGLLRRRRKLRNCRARRTSMRRVRRYLRGSLLRREFR
jgi:hypothetical protein